MLAVDSLALLFFPAAMAFAGAMDLVSMTIPNRISLAMIAGFFCAALWAGLPANVVLAHVAAGVLMLAAGIGMFAMGWVGGGDAKLLAAGALWLGPSSLVPFLLLTGLLGAVLMLALVTYRGYPASALPLPAWAVRLHHSKTGIPYGIAIGTAGLLIFPCTPLFKALA